MQDEYVNKIIEIGQKDICTSEDLAYFSKKLPDVGNMELRDILPRKYKVNTGHITRKDFLLYDKKINNQSPSEDQEKHISFLVDFIKGCHLIEIKYGGFGSTTNIYNIIGSLLEIDADKAIDLYNWIAFNGGNYYIEPNVTYEDCRRREQSAEKNRVEILLNDQKVHSDAVARKQQKRDSHAKISTEKQKLYKELKENFERMSDEQLKNEVEKTDLGSTHARYRSALREELKKRSLNKQKTAVRD